MTPLRNKSITLNKKTYTLDAFGFLHPPEQWDKNYASEIARILGIYQGLTDKHWNFIRYLRKKFVNENTVPVVVYACADNKLRLREFRKLFPTGYHRGACKIAGINYEFMFKTNHWLTYEAPSYLKTKYKMTSTGFLIDPNKWSEDFAHFVIQGWNLKMGVLEKHLQIIFFLRQYFAATQNIPTIFETCEANSIGLKEIHELFPEGYRRGACRVAGLPFFG